MAGIGTGVAEGVGGAVFEHLVDSDSAPVAVDYSICFFALDQVLDDSGVYAVGQLPAGDQSAPNPGASSSDETEDPRDDLDDLEQDPWLAVPGELGPEYVVWKEAGFLPQDALDWSAFGFGSQESLRWVAYGFSPSEARAWIDRTRDGNSYPHAIEPGDAMVFAEDEVSPDEAMGWLEHGFEATEAVEWRAYDFEPEEALGKTRG